MTRIEPLQPPYELTTAALLQEMMPPGQPPIGLFRTFVRNPAMTEAMRGWGGYELSHRLSLSMRERELVIDRTTARCRCEYEWGVHIAFFADRIGLTADQLRSVTHGSPHDGCWLERRERLLLQLVDALHDHADIDDELWAGLDRHFDAAEILDATMLCGWYHAISYAANTARVQREPGAPAFVDVS